MQPFSSEKVDVFFCSQGHGVEPDGVSSVISATVAAHDQDLRRIDWDHDGQLARREHIQVYLDQAPLHILVAPHFCHRVQRLNAVKISVFSLTAEHVEGAA